MLSHPTVMARSRAVTFGVRCLCLAAGYDLHGVARRTGIPARRLKACRDNGAPLTVGELDAIARLLGMSAGQLIEAATADPRISATPLAAPTR